MKKLMTLCFFTFAMILGTQTMAAQSMVEVNAKAAIKTKELKQALKLNNDIEENVYNAYQEYLEAVASLEQKTASGKTISPETQKKVDNMLVDKFRVIFTEDQLKRYLEYAAKHH